MTSASDLQSQNTAQLAQPRHLKTSTTAKISGLGREMTIVLEPWVGNALKF